MVAALCAARSSPACQGCCFGMLPTVAATQACCRRARSPLSPPPPLPHPAAPAPPRRLCVAALQPTPGGSQGSAFTASSARGPREQTRKQGRFWLRLAFRVEVMVILAMFYVFFKYVMPCFLPLFYVTAAFVVAALAGMR